MLGDNEKIYIKFYECYSVEDDYENGEMPSSGGVWGRDDNCGCLGVKYTSVADALHAVLEEMCFKWRGLEAWTSLFAEECDEAHRGLFEFSTMVDEHNDEVGDDDIERWRKGEKRLYTCYVTVALGVRAERGLTDEECSLTAAK